MRDRRIHSFFIIIILIGIFSTQQLTVNADHIPRGEYSSTEVIVKFRTVSRFAKDQVTQEAGAQDSRQLMLERTTVLTVPERAVEQVIRILSRSPFVEYAEPNIKMQAVYTPNDPFTPQQWALNKIDLYDAWDLASGTENIPIGILDTGIDRNHEDLSDRLDLSANFTNSSSPDDLYGHGTHVAGIAAAVSDNNTGIAGVGKSASLMSVKVLNDNGSGYTSWIADGIVYAIDNGAKVINLSLGSAYSSLTLMRAIDYAWQQGAVIVCAAGNNGNSSRFYPAYYDNCIATAATNQNDQKTSWSSYGSWVDVAAPGDSIFSTLPNHRSSISSSLNYGNVSGTSMAAPHVAGLAALLWSNDPSLTNEEIRSMIETYADGINGTGQYWLHGRINAYQSLLQTGQTDPTPTPTDSGTPTNTPTPTDTPTMTPTPTYTPTPTNTPTPTFTPSPTPTAISTATPTPQQTQPTPNPNLPWWCAYIPWHRTCR